MDPTLPNQPLPGQIPVQAPTPIPTQILNPVTEAPPPVINNPPPVNQPIIPSSQHGGSKSKLLIIGAILLIILILGGVGAWALLNKKGGNTTGGNKSGIGGILKPDLSKYDVDTDRDTFPDFIETELGLNPNLSEYETCRQNSTCLNPNYQQTQAKPHNVLVILDVSGSMNLKIGSQTRMEIAKQAIKNYVNKSAGKTNIGLMVYGHKGSNNQSDKVLSCSSAEIVSQISTVNAQNIDGLLSAFQPTGWTLIGRAISESAKAFTGKEGQKNEIVILSDGEETCDTNPVGAAQALKSSGIAANVNIIGFAVDSKAQTQLSQISLAGGGIYATASNADELDRKFNDLYENSLKAVEFSKCMGNELTTVTSCYQAAYDKVYQYMVDKKLTFSTNKISREEYNKLDELTDVVYDKLKVERDSALKTFDEMTKSENQKVFGQ